MGKEWGRIMESPRFENQSDAEDYIRELESNHQITAEEIELLISFWLKRLVGRTSNDGLAITHKDEIQEHRQQIAKAILSKYKVVEK